MKAFSCGDVVPGCTASFEAKSEDEILSQVAEHAKKDHEMRTISQEIIAAVKAKIRDSRVA